MDQTESEIRIEVVAEEPLVPMERVLPFVDPVFRSIVQVGDFRRAQPLIFVQSRALRLMESHTRSTLKQEVGGLLLGNFYCHNTISFTYVEAAVPALQARSGSGSLFFSATSLQDIEEIRQTNYAHLRSVGWYHSHPGFGIFLSPTDLYSHRTTFNGGPFVAMVLDPVNRSDGIFAWMGKEIAGPLGYWIASS